MKGTLEPSAPSIIPNPCASIFLTIPIILSALRVQGVLVQHLPWPTVEQGTSIASSADYSSRPRSSLYAAKLQPDLVVLDFKMPLANRIKAGREIPSSMPTIPIVMYTLYRTPELEVASSIAAPCRISPLSPSEDCAAGKRSGREGYAEPLRQ